MGSDSGLDLCILLTFRNENVWRMKVDYFKMSYLKTIDQILNFANFENWAMNIQRGILQVMLNILSVSSLSRIDGTLGYFGMQK